MTSDTHSTRAEPWADARLNQKVGTTSALSGVDQILEFTKHESQPLVKILQCLEVLA